MPSASSTNDFDWNQWMSMLGRRMRNLRQSLGLTQEQLARQAGVSQGSLSRFESGASQSVAGVIVLKFVVALARQSRGPTQQLLVEAIVDMVRRLESLGTPSPANTLEQVAEARPSAFSLGAVHATDGAQRAVLRRERDSWLIAYHGSVHPLRDSKGLRYLATLLRHPGRRVRASSLFGVGRSAPEDRARVSVTKAIRRAVDRIVAVRPELGRHLIERVQTGVVCAYQDGDPKIVWDIIESD